MGDIYVQKKLKGSLIDDLRKMGRGFTRGISDESEGEFHPIMFIGNWDGVDRPGGCERVSNRGDEERSLYHRCIWFYQGITSLTLSKYVSQPVMVDDKILGNIIEPEEFTFIVELIDENINGELFGKILEAIKPRILRFLKEDEDYKTIRERFHVSACKQINKERQILARNEADNVRNLTETQVQLGIVDNAISILESGNGAENIEREAEKIEELKKDGIIDSLSIRNGYLRVMFSKFMYKPAKGIKIEIGPILLKYKIDHGSIRTYTQEDTYKCKIGNYHPHISCDGKCCFGNMQDTIHTMFKACRMVEAISMFRVFLESYDEKNPYVKLDIFMPPDPKKEKKAKKKEAVEAQPESEERRPSISYAEFRVNSLEGAEYIATGTPSLQPLEGSSEGSPCDGCERSGSPFCAQECETGGFGCDDCNNVDEPEYCSLDCQYNMDWARYNPCLDCTGANMTCHQSTSCIYLVRAVMNGARRHPCDPEGESLQGIIEDETTNEPVTRSASERYREHPSPIPEGGEYAETTN